MSAMRAQTILRDFPFIHSFIDFSQNKNKKYFIDWH